MYKIDWAKGFTGIDGIHRDRAGIEQWYIEALYYKKGRNRGETKIRVSLETLARRQNCMMTRRYLEFLIRHLDEVLLARPARLEALKAIADRLEAKLWQQCGRERIITLKKEILSAFNYHHFRKNVLVELAARLNVKTCPYCNQHFTLCLKTDVTEAAPGRKAMLAAFQFDHFIEKAAYPMFSMSLYNLVPSCPLCNNAKGVIQLSLRYHPYCTACNGSFSFHLKNGLKYIYGGTTDRIEVELLPHDTRTSEEQVALREYDNALRISARYSRHKDIADEIFARAYTETYYADDGNFGFLKFPAHLGIPETVARRIRDGGYTNPQDFGRRPLSKFTADLTSQARHIRDSGVDDNQ